MLCSARCPVCAFRVTYNMRRAAAAQHGDAPSEGTLLAVLQAAGAACLPCPFNLRGSGPRNAACLHGPPPRPHAALQQRSAATGMQTTVGQQGATPEGGLLAVQQAASAAGLHGSRCLAPQESQHDVHLVGCEALGPTDPRSRQVKMPHLKAPPLQCSRQPVEYISTFCTAFTPIPPVTSTGFTLAVDHAADTNFGAWTRDFVT